MRAFSLAMILSMAALLGARQAVAADQDYSAIGPGHFIQSVSDDGALITLEDKSRWAIDPRVRFKTMHWQHDAGISVRRATPENGFTYELDNIDEDDGVLARYLPHGT
jgi:hypothetical protein